MFHCKNYKADLESGLYENIRISAKLPPRIRKTFTPQSIGHRQVLAGEIFLKGNQQAVAQQASICSLFKVSSWNLSEQKGFVLLESMSLYCCLEMQSKPKPKPEKTK